MAMNQEKNASADTPADPIEDGGYRFIFGFYFVAFVAAFLFCLFSLLGSIWR